jgi:glycosyltransferase involved in cell wall biosynthesis
MGSFRAWHGVLDFVRAALLLIEAGTASNFVLVGDGPERAAAEALAMAAPGRFRFSGAIPYEQIPAALAEASIGVAPFVTAPHPALRAAGFFWSPLKVFEYMAAGLPVVTPNIAPLNSIVRHEHEGLLYPEGNGQALAAAIQRLLDQPALAETLGRKARQRVVEHYSWQRHCAELERVLVGMSR